MRKLLVLLLLAGAVYFAYYKGWFSVSVDKDKAKADIQEMTEKGKEVGKEVVEKAKEGAEKMKEGADKLKKDVTEKKDAEKTEPKETPK